MPLPLTAIHELLDAAQIEHELLAGRVHLARSLSATYDAAPGDLEGIIDAAQTALDRAGDVYQLALQLATVCGIAAPSPEAADEQPDVPPPAPNPAEPVDPGPPAAGATPDYPAIAAAIKRIKAAGQPVTSTLADEYGVPKTTTNNWYSKCRKLGLLDDTPAAPPAAPVKRDGKRRLEGGGEPTIPGKVFSCEDCDVDTTSTAALTAHTVSAHNRPPRRDERTPVAPSA
jgi:hypothetical protein